MKRLWARIGVAVDVTDEEYVKIKTLLQENEEEAIELLKQLFTNNGYLNGDSYMPGNYIGGCEDNPNDEEFTLWEAL